jgi:hypothetical protein
VSSAQITLKQIMKIHRQVNISRRDVQHIMANGKVVVIHDRWLLLVLFGMKVVANTFVFV